MMDFQSVVDFIRNFFEPHRKRRAVDPIDHRLSSKHRRLNPPMARDIDDFRLNSRILKPSIKLSPRQNPHIDMVVLDDDDDDDDIEIKNPFVIRNQNKTKAAKFTSTPENDAHVYTNGISDDEVTFVKEVKSPKDKKMEASKKGFQYIKPFTGHFTNGATLHNDTKSKPLFNHISSSTRNQVTSRPSIGSSSLDYSVRLDDKNNYKRLLEAATGSSSANDAPNYLTPVGKLFNYDTANRSIRIINAALKSPTNITSNLNNSKEKMTIKDRIKKVLDDFENGTVLVKDSDSESDVILVSPPSPKPDIKVEPVNSFKKVVDTTEQTKRDWLDDIIERHKKSVEQRQKEIDELRQYSDKHGKINRTMKWEVLTDKLNRSLSIKDSVLPIREEEEEAELPPLTEAQLMKVEWAFRGDSNEVLVKKFNLNITRRDLQTLAGLNWLNDEVINFYMNLIIERSKDSKWPKAFAFNTFFYTKLIKDGPQSLRRWTKRVDIFAQDLICVPIHLGMHWCMAIIDFRDKSIRYYDSMGSSNNKCLEALRNYLEVEHLDKKKTEYDTSDFVVECTKEIPQQMNGSDCGMFSCTFAEFITRNAKITFGQEHMPYLRKKMVIEILYAELLIK